MNQKNQINHGSDIYDLTEEEIRIVEGVCTMIFMIHMIAMIKGRSLNQLNHTNQINHGSDNYDLTEEEIKIVEGR